MGVRIKGLDRLNRKLSEMPKALQNATWDATFEVTEEVRGRAESELASSVKHGSGELLGSVKNEVETNKDGKLVGRVWTDKKQGVFSLCPLC